mmetsp:Transcript_76350/g.210786  ORF Transcript_76350/g.210786 Transcript_76350/m.210786 type:complete len:317 (-) Transcript_76350:105-1055(-)
MPVPACRPRWRGPMRRAPRCASRHKSGQSGSAPLQPPRPPTPAQAPSAGSPCCPPQRWRTAPGRVRPAPTAPRARRTPSRCHRAGPRVARSAAMHWGPLTALLPPPLGRPARGQPPGGGQHTLPRVSLASCRASGHDVTSSARRLQFGQQRPPTPTGYARTPAAHNPAPASLPPLEPRRRPGRAPGAPAGPRLGHPVLYAGPLHPGGHHPPRGASSRRLACPPRAPPQCPVLCPLHPVAAGRAPHPSPLPPRAPPPEAMRPSRDAWRQEGCRSRRHRAWSFAPPPARTPPGSRGCKGSGRRRALSGAQPGRAARAP